MKILTSFAATLFAGACLSVLQAQTIGDDLTSSMQNPGFEEEHSTTASNGRIFVPNGWTFNKVSEGWNDYRVVTHMEVASDGKNSYFDSYEGEKHVSYWGEKVTSLDLFQEVSTLPVGGYQFSAMVRLVTHQSTLTAEEKITDQHLYAKTQEGDSTISSFMPLSAVGDTPENWTRLNVLFNVRTEGETVRLGIASTNNGTNDAGGFQIDDCRITYLGNGDAFVAQMQAALAEYIPLAEGITPYDIVSGTYDELDKALQVAREAASSVDSAQLETAVNLLKAAYKDAEKAIDLKTTLVDAITQASENAALGYPGLTTFQEVIDNAIGICNSEVEYLVYLEDLEKAIADLAIASRKYQLSSLEGASESSPKDATWVISCPSFTDLETGNPASTGWICENIPATSKEYRLNTVNGKNCWNSWSDNFTRMDIFQELTGLPAGRYVVSCTTTTNGIPHDQHAYATSSTGTATSDIPSYYYEGSDFTNESAWSDPLRTNQLFVSNDGKLRIGMRSTSGGGTSGWFCVTDFTLTYYGITASDYTDALNTRIDEIAAFQDSTLLKGDQSLVSGIVTDVKNSGNNTPEEMDASFALLNKAEEIATQSISAYRTYMNGAYATSTQFLTPNDTTVTHATAKALLKKVVDTQGLVIQSDTTHYAIVPTLTGQLNAYNGYIASYNKALGYAEQTAYMNTLVANQNRVNEYPSRSEIDSLHNELKAANTLCMAYENALFLADESLNMGGYTSEGVAAMHAVINAQEAAFQNATSPDAIEKATQAIILGVRALQLATTGEGPKDITSWINNPTIIQDNNNTNIVPNGWSGTTSGSNGHFTKDKSGDTYLETWNGTASTINFNYYQEISNLPAGYYRLVAAAYNCQGAVPNGNGVLYALSNKGEYQTPVSTQSALAGDSLQLDDATFVDYTVDRILVTYGSLTIGVKNIGPLSAKWFAADDFRLYFLEAAEAEEPIGIEEVAANSVPALVAYSVDGYLVVENEEDYTVTTLTGAAVSPSAKLTPGIYIVKAGTRSTKIAVK